jgi:tetratricopeptide (TPR) repeat protein
MKRRTYESAPLPISLPANKYFDGVNNQVFIVERTNDPVDVATIIEWVNSENRATKLQYANELLDIIPSRTIRIPVDADKVIASGTVKYEDRDLIVPYIDITLRGNSILKSQLVVLDILANNNWERPIYFVAGYHNDAFGLEEYFQLEGIAYRLVPIRSENRGWLDYGRIDADILYDNMINKFAWGGANDPKVYIDHFHKRTLSVVRARLNYARLAKALVERGDNEKAIEVLDRCMEHFPLFNIPYDHYFGDLIEAYFQAGAVEKATEMAIDFKDYYFERLSYYLRQNQYVLSSAEYEIQTALQFTSRVADSCERHGNPELAEEINDKLQTYYTEYTIRAQSQRQ